MDKAIRIDENCDLVYEDADFRRYAPIKVKNRLGREIEMTLCADKIGGRWEYFYTSRDWKLR